jgi:hypothetical protein
MDMEDHDELIRMKGQVDGLNADVSEIKADVKAIREVILTDLGARRAGWKVITAIGACVVGFATVAASFGGVFRHLFK